MATKIQVRRDTAANWTSADPTLSDGEIGYETDTGYMKIGDGSTAYSSLGYFTPGAAGGDQNTTYTYSIAQAGGDATMTLAGSDATNDVVTLVAGSQLTLTVAGDNVTMDVDNDLANYSNATTAFISDITAEAIGSLSDVDVSAVADGSVLAYDQVSGNWVAGDPAVSAIGDLSDVDSTGATTGSILVYSTAGPGEFVASNSFGGDLGNNQMTVFGPFDYRFGTVYGQLKVRSIDPYQSDYDMGSDNGGVFFVGSQNVNIDWNFTGYEPSLAMRKFRIIINNNLSIVGPADIDGTVDNPTTTPGNTVIINGQTVTLTGTTLQNAIDDINTAAITDVTANNYGGDTIASVQSTGIGTINPGDSILINGNPVDLSGSTNPFTIANDINGYGYAGFEASVFNSQFLVITADRGVDLTLAENGGAVLPELGLTAGTTSYVPGTALTISYAPQDFTSYDDFRARSYLDIGNGTANTELGLTNGSTQSIDFDGCPGISITNFKIRGATTSVRNSAGTDGFPAGKIGGWDIYELECVANAGGTDIGNGTPIQWFVKHWNETPNVVTGDLTGSVFADDSTLLVDGVNGTIPAANISGALPAIDGSNLLNIGTLTEVLDDTTPQLGGNLDLNSADITGTGNIDITGNIINTGDTTVTGTLKVDSGNNIVIEKTVSGNNETFGNIIATTGTTEYAKIEFKTGADGFADNSEINWFSRVGGSSVQIFEIKGSSLGKSGFEINPGANLNVDFFMQGAADPTLIFADAGLDKVGFGKIPTQGKVDVDGDIYATTIRGTIVATAGTAPTAGSDPGDEGEIRFDNDYIYVKTPGGSWKRTALSSIV